VASLSACLLSLPQLKPKKFLAGCSGIGSFLSLPHTRSLEFSPVSGDTRILAHPAVENRLPQRTGTPSTSTSHAAESPRSLTNQPLQRTKSKATNQIDRSLRQTAPCSSPPEGGPYNLVSSSRGPCGHGAQRFGGLRVNSSRAYGMHHDGSGRRCGWR
jgi:hypothetical protein